MSENTDLPCRRGDMQCLLADMPAMMHAVDAEGRLQAVSRKWLDTLGYARDEVLGRPAAEFFTEGSRAHVAEVVQPALARHGECHDLACQMQARDGRRIDVLLSANCERDASGAFQRSVSVMQDITAQRNLERRLTMNEKALKEAQNVAHLGSWVADHRTGELIWSDEIFRLLDLAPATEPSIAEYLSRIHPDDLMAVKFAYRRFREDGQAYSLRHRLLLPDGGIKYLHQRVLLVVDDDNLPGRSLGTVQDVTMTVLQELAYRESEERFRTVADYTYDWEYWEGPEKEILYISPSCQRVTGYTQSEFIDDPELAVRIIHPADQAAFNQHLGRVAEGQGGAVNFRIIRKDGEVRWIAHGCRQVYAADGERRGRRVSNRDITDLKQAEELASHLAHYDMLTGLPNRRLLQDRLGLALSHAARHNRPMALMFIDLDRFKPINDELGHEIGDQLLAEVARRLTASVRDSDTVARMGGDEFVVVLPEIGGPLDACAVAEKLNRALRDPVRVGMHVLEISSSIGIAVRLADSEDDANDLMRKADQAMYAAKEAGRDGFRLYS